MTQEVKKYSHACDIAFEVESQHSCETDDSFITPREVRDALLQRIERLSDKELMEAIDVFDTFEMEL